MKGRTRIVLFIICWTFLHVQSENASAQSRIGSFDCKSKLNTTVADAKRVGDTLVLTISNLNDRKCDYVIEVLEKTVKGWIYSDLFTFYFNGSLKGEVDGYFNSKLPVVFADSYNIPVHSVSAQGKLELKYVVTKQATKSIVLRLRVREISSALAIDCPPMLSKPLNFVFVKPLP